MGGGGNPSQVSTMDKLTYSSDTTAAVPGAVLSVPKRSMGATGNSTAGYFAGGLANSISPGQISTVDKLTYASDTTAALPSGSN